MQSNFAGLLDKCKTILNSWQNRQLSLSGKVIVINSLIASLFVYKFSVLPNVPFSFITEFEDIISKFLGNGKKSRIPLRILQLSKSQGGLRLVDLFKRQIALKAQWVISIRDSEKWANIAYTYLNPYIKERIWLCNINNDDIDQISPRASFWYQVLDAWARFNFFVPKVASDIKGQIIWYNSNLRIDNKIFCNVKAWDAGLIYVADLFSNNGLLLSFDQLLAKFGNCISWFEHVQIIMSIPLKWKQAILMSPASSVNRITKFESLAGASKISNIVYDSLIDNSVDISSILKVWERRLSVTIHLQELLNAFDAIKAPTIYTKLRDFQFRLLHNKIFTNFNLFVWCKRADDFCTFCSSEREHTLHLFIDCPVTARVWLELQEFIIHCIGHDSFMQLDWTNQSILFNNVHCSPGHVINLLTLIAKQYIYKSRCMLT